MISQFERVNILCYDNIMTQEEIYKKIEDVAQQNGGAFSTACFLSQQMAEKYLKGLLVFFDRPFPKIHDLLDLETALLPDLPKIQDLHPYLKELNRYYTETRYPGDYPEFTLRAAQDAHQAAIRIKDFILGVVNKK